MPYRPNLKEIEAAYSRVLENWESIDDLLDTHKVGRKDTPFNQPLMDNLLTAWDFVDYLIRKQESGLLSKYGGPDMLEINNLVHYGEDFVLRAEYHKAIKATEEKFTKLIPPIRKYYEKKMERGSSVYKIAAEVFISIVGQPQLFIEGNHRSGSIIASWINMAHDRPPFVLTEENALTFFEPAQVIKKFNKQSRWRSVTKLPKYKNNFRRFWEDHCDMRFALKL